MANASLAQIRAALAAALVAELDDSQTVSPYVLADPHLPIVWVRLQTNAPIAYHLAMGQGGEVQKWTFLIEAYAGSLDDVAAQQKLDVYLSPGSQSIYQALVADITLGDVVKNLHVTGCNAYVEFRRADGTGAIGANWQVEVYP
jgi:hypothetical protein